MRHWFGANHADWVFTPGPDHVEDDEAVGPIPVLVPDTTVTFWTEEEGGTQITDLLDADEEPVTQVSTDEFGNIPRLQGPEDVTSMWASASGDGSERRYLMTAVDLGEQLAEVDARSAANQNAVDDLDARLDTVEATPTRVSRWHDVTALEYGAVGDGTTDAAAAIQAALDQVLADGGGGVWIPGGTYSLTAPLRIYRNTHLKLASDAVLRRDTEERMLINGDAGQDLPGYTGHGDLLIEGGTWDGRGTEASEYDNLINIGHAERVTIRDTTILDVPGYHAIEMNSTRTGRIERVRCLGLVQSGDRDFSEAIQLDGAYRPSVFGSFGPYDHTPCVDVTVSGCTIGPSQTAGSGPWGRGIGSHSTTAGHPHQDIQVRGCDIRGTLECAIGAYVWDRALIHGNIINGCGAGIWARTLDSSKVLDRTDDNEVDTEASQVMYDLSIIGNIVRDCQGWDSGIRWEGEDTGVMRRVAVIGNIVEGTAGSTTGLRHVYSQDSTVTGNVVHGTGGTAISQADVVGAVVTGNRVTSSGGSGMTLDERDLDSGTDCDVTLADNVVTGAATNGIHLFGGASITLQGNRVRAVDDPGSAGYGIRISSSAHTVLLIGNDVADTTNDALSITATCSDIHRGPNRLDGTVADGSSGRWIEPTMLNDWEHYGSTFQIPRFRRDLDGRVHLEGLITGGTVGEPAFVLPVGYRPSHALLHTSVSASTDPPDVARVQIFQDGDVIPQDTVGDYVSLNVSFTTQD